MGARRPFFESPKSEMSDDEYDSPREVSWSRSLPSRPPLRSLIGLTAGAMTAPLPLSADIQKAGVKAEEELAAAGVAVVAAEKEVAAITEQLKNISTVDANRWNRRAANVSEKSKIEAQLMLAQERRSAAIAKQTALNAETQLVRGIIRLHEQTIEAYAEYERDLFASWKDEYGEEAAMTVDEIGGTPEAVGGFVRHHLPVGTDVNAIYRRLRLGGAPKVRVLDTSRCCWVETRTAATNKN